MNTQSTTFFESRLFKSDMRLLEKSGYKVVKDREITSTEAERIASLYRLVYLDRHSSLNPQWNQRFVELMLNAQVLHIKVLKKGEKIDAVVGYYRRNGVMTSPFVGYDAQQSQEVGLYRMASTVLTLSARENNEVFHLSSGAEFFKKIRKAESNLEYLAVHHRHLPWKRKLPWLILRAVCNTIGIPIMKSYGQ